MSYLPTFATTVVLFVVVGASLFFGRPWRAAPVESASNPRLVVNAAMATPRRSLPTPIPTFVATPEPPRLAVVLIQATPASSPIATAAPTPTAVPPAVSLAPATAVPLGLVHVGNTAGDGVFLHHTPVLSDRWIAWPDHTPLIVLGDEADGDGQHWLQVRDPKQNVGWIPAQYLIQ